MVKWVGQKGPPPSGSQALKIYVGSIRVKVDCDTISVKESQDSTYVFSVFFLGFAGN